MAVLNPEILITARDEASAVLRGVGKNASDLGSTIKNGLKDNLIPLTAAFGAVTGVVATSIKAFSDSEDALSQLDAVLQSTKGSAGVTRDEVIKLATAWQQHSRFSDEAVLSSENMLLTFTKIGKDVFPQATETVLNMSQALGQDLQSSSIQLGKALNDPINGVTALKRVGVEFDEQQQQQIKTMAESGNLLGAQKLILKELATEFGGSATAASRTFSGQLEILKNDLNDVQETIGKGLLDTLGQMFGGMDNVSKKIVELNSFLIQNQDVLKATIAALLVLVATFGVLVVAALIATAGAAGLLIAAFGALVAASAFVASMAVSHWTQIRNFIADSVRNIINFIQAILPGALQVIDSLTGNWISKFNNLRNAVQDIMNFIGGLVNNFHPNFSIGINLPDIVGAWNNLRNQAHHLGIPGFATGGIVPGSIGQPQLILAHGGETITPYNGRSSGGGSGGGTTINLNIGMYAGTETEKRSIAQELYRQLMLLAGSQNKTVAEFMGS